jgi:hypothetical protein
VGAVDEALDAAKRAIRGREAGHRVIVALLALAALVVLEHQPRARRRERGHAL